MNNVQVYRHLKPNGETFYIGIGKDNRPYSKGYRNRWWKNVVKKYPNYEVQVLKSDLSWKDACELEQILISYYGRKDLGKGTLVNLTDGGDGSFGRKHSKEAKDKISKANKGKKRSQEVKDRISKISKENYKPRKNFGGKGKDNPFYGKKHSEETKLKLSKLKTKPNKKIYYKNVRLVKVDNSEWMTVSELAKKLGYKSNSTITRHLQGKPYIKKLSKLNLQSKVVQKESCRGKKYKK